ncbi:MAG: glycoside hydrolase family 13 protein [Clostridiales bacterium]|nr:glycoside hydrolase family 13 protein [Clostridiales bacterium]
MNIFHDSHSAVYRCPTGAAPCGSTITLRLLTQGVRAATLRVWCGDRESFFNMTAVGSDIFSHELKLPDKPCLLWYYFLAEGEDGTRMYYGNNGDQLGGQGEMRTHEPASWQVTVYDGAFETPEWMRNGVMMQIMVDRFHSSGNRDREKLPEGSFFHRTWDEDPVLVINDRIGDYSANDFFGGDLKGVEQKLDDLKAMGITVLYFNPIFKAHSNHKYDTGDYRQIDPTFGTEEDFKRLCAEAEKRGIRVVLDGVFSHTGADSRYFNLYGTYGTGGAYNDRNSRYASWYQFNHWPDDYQSWWGFKTLPNVDKDNKDFRRFIIEDEDSVVKHWLNAGASGWRLDVADELPMDFIASLRAHEKSLDPDNALIGEVWEDPSNKISYGKMRCYCLGDTLDATMNYPLREAVLLFMTGRLDAVTFVRRLESQRENLPKPFFYSQMNLLGSHDRPRALSVLADVGDMQPDRLLRKAIHLNDEDYARGRRRLIAAWRMICALPGMPCVYYGDDAGMVGMSDPFCRGTYPWGHEDRTIKKAFAEIIAKRMASPALRTGTLTLKPVGSDVVMIFREIADDRDAFGKPAEDELRVLAVNRACESRWVEFAGKAVEVKGESAQWLH